MANVSTIALCTPIIASNAIFSARRADRSVDSFEEQPLYSIANANIALAQTLKGARAVKSIAIAADNGSYSSAMAFENASDAIKALSKKNKIVNGAVKTLNFTAKNINPVICFAGGLNVLSEEDKIEALADESGALATMFLAENATKKIIDMPAFGEKNRIVSKATTGGKSSPINQCLNLIDDYCGNILINNKRPLKGISGVIKGLTFAGASIGGYKLGDKLTDIALGKEKQN